MPGLNMECFVGLRAGPSWDHPSHPVVVYVGRLPAWCATLVPRFGNNPAFRELAVHICS